MYTVYRITNRLNGKYYIGVHKTGYPNDSYFGSGLAILAAIKKYGKQNFVKAVLFVFDNAEDAYNKEIELTNDFHKFDTYNMRRGGVGGFTRDNALKGALAANLKIDKSARVASGKKGGISTVLRKVGLFAEHANSSRKGGLAHKGRKKSESHKEKLKQSLLGKKRPIEVCRKLSLAKIGKPLSLQCRTNIGKAMRESWARRKKILDAKSKSGDPLLITG